MFCRMAVFARFRLSVLCELPSVRIFVAAGAIRRSRFERRLGEFAASSRRLMALLTHDLGMRPAQRKVRLRMVKAWQVGPGFHRVARFAAGRPPVLYLLHLRFKLLAVRVPVATRARQAREMVRHSFRSARRQVRRVAFHARHRQMRTLQRKLALLVLRNRKRRWLESVYRVARFASSIERRRRELPSVCIRMAVRAF